MAKPIKANKIAKANTPELTLRKAPVDKEFILADGKRIKDYLDLVIAFRDMPEEVFMHHVNGSRNDFSSWVLGVFEDKELADLIKKQPNKNSCQIVTIKHIASKL